MSVYELASFREAKGKALITSLLNRKYIPQSIKGRAERKGTVHWDSCSKEPGLRGGPKGNGKTRLLGVSTVVDRWLQQAVSRQLASKFELEFAEQSYGFRPQRNTQQAVRQSLKFRAKREF